MVSEIAVELRSIVPTTLIGFIALLVATPALLYLYSVVVHCSRWAGLVDDSEHGEATREFAVAGTATLALAVLCYIIGRLLLFVAG